METSKILQLLLLFVWVITTIHARETCQYQNGTGTVSITCADSCCSRTATTASEACCSSFSWSSIAVSFFVIAGICIAVICLIYCRPLCKTLICPNKCPFGQRSRVSTANPTASNDNPVFVINNDGLPDYEMITKDPHASKDPVLPSYAFVAEHPNDFGIETRVPSAPPRYDSRRPSEVTTVGPSSSTVL